MFLNGHLWPEEEHEKKEGRNLVSVTPRKVTTKRTKLTKKVSVAALTMMKTDLVPAIVRTWNLFQWFLWSIIFVFVAGIIATCPDSRLIAPCQCQTENNVVSMVCANLQSVQQLMKIFEPPFPVNQLWHLTVKHSQLDDLEANLLGDKSFAVILFQNITGVNKIMPHAFAASVERLRVLTFDSSPSLGVLSVQGIADLENLVDFEVTASVDHLIVCYRTTVYAT